MKKKIILCLGALLLILKIHAQPINPEIFGQNAWYIDVTNPMSANGISAYLQAAADAGVKTIRIGGRKPAPQDLQSCGTIVKLKDL